MQTWHVGDSVTLKATFTNTTGTVTDPTTVTLEVKDPSSNQDTYTYAGATVTKNSTGVYQKSITFDEAGWWTYEWEGTGTVAAVENNKILVKAQAI